ncbi:unnamed protein product [Brassica oleracea var. botrytis]|uniref:(rape) hypothetical protein n=1 Tax=Brassica napus TaxID=3708 RepID=A0A816IWY9_BRANA|nr:unnamed protein product [Brassica napus]
MLSFEELDVAGVVVYFTLEGVEFLKTVNVSHKLLHVVIDGLRMVNVAKLTKPTLPHSNQQTKASFKTSEINHNTKDLQSTGKLEDHQPPCLRLLQTELQC